jgi:hypothetical protein
VANEAVSSLIKFCTVDTGVKILSSQALRWSAPNLFSDPFELQYHSRPDTSAATLLEVLLREALIMLFGPNLPTGRHNRLVNIMARWREQQRFCDEVEAKSVLTELLGQIAELQEKQVEQYLQAWQKFSRTTRIACFVDKPNNIASWQRYADQYRGIALRFESGEDTGLPKPQKVLYQTHAPVVTSQQEQLEIIYGRRNAPTVESFPEKLLIKGRHDHLENEWRCFSTTQQAGVEDENAWYEHRPFPAHELRAVYFGTHTPQEDKEVIYKLIRTNYPTAKVYQAAVSQGRYEIEFSLWSSR